MRRPHDGMTRSDSMKEQQQQQQQQQQPHCFQKKKNVVGNHNHNHSNNNNHNNNNNNNNNNNTMTMSTMTMTMTPLMTTKAMTTSTITLTPSDDYVDGENNKIVNSTSLPLRIDACKGSKDCYQCTDSFMYAYISAELWSLSWVQGSALSCLVWQVSLIQLRWSQQRLEGATAYPLSDTYFRCCCCCI